MTQASGANVIQGYPELDSRIANPDFTITRTWAGLLRQLWLRTGGSFNYVVTATVQGLLWLIESGTSVLALVGGQLNAGQTAVVVTTPVAGGTAQALAPAGSPWPYVAAFQGTLLACGARVDLSRDNGVTYFPVTLTGGAVPMLTGDIAKLTWYSAVAPTVTFLPGGA